MEQVSRTNQVHIDIPEHFWHWINQLRWHLSAIYCALFWAQKVMVWSKKTPLETHKSLPGQSLRCQSGSA